MIKKEKQIYYLVHKLEVLEKMQPQEQYMLQINQNQSYSICF